MPTRLRAGERQNQTSPRTGIKWTDCFKVGSAQASMSRRQREIRWPPDGGTSDVWDFYFTESKGTISRFLGHENIYSVCGCVLLASSNGREGGGFLRILSGAVTPSRIFPQASPVQTSKTRVKSAARNRYPSMVATIQGRYIFFRLSDIAFFFPDGFTSIDGVVSTPESIAQCIDLLPPFLPPFLEPAPIVFPHLPNPCLRRWRRRQWSVLQQTPVSPPPPPPPIKSAKPRFFTPDSSPPFPINFLHCKHASNLYPFPTPPIN